MNEEKVEKSAEKLDLIRKIEELERLGEFDKDVLPDPPTIELKPEKIDYLRKNPINRLKMGFANFCARKLISKLVKSKALVVKEIKGAENFLKVGKSGAILTCNHFSPNDSFLMQLGLEAGCKYNKHKKRMFKVIREGNYTNPPVFKFFMQNCNTLPLSQNSQTMRKFMRAVNELLARGDYVLIYPEESLWPDYRKPKPLKPGAYRFAVKNNVPVIPFFITMEDGERIGPDGFPIQEYTIHILPPIYANQDLSDKEQIEDMKNRNYQAWVKVYEDFYGKKLEYITEEK